MEGCNQTNIPILNTQEDPCIQGSLLTNCIFYGLAIEYLGTQNTASLAVILEYIVRSLVAANSDIVALEEENRDQQLLIEQLQVALEQSLVTLEVIQSQVEACCPTTTTTTTPITTSTTTSAPTTTTTTTSGPNAFSVTWVSPEQTFSCELPRITVYSSSNVISNNTRLFRNSNLTNELQDGTLYVQVLPFGEINNMRLGTYIEGSGLYALNGITSCDDPTTTATPFYTFNVDIIPKNDENLACSTYGSILVQMFSNVPTLVTGSIIYNDSSLTDPWSGYGLERWYAVEQNSSIFSIQVGRISDGNTGVILTGPNPC
jgi:hypothetical protein